MAATNLKCCKANLAIHNSKFISSCETGLVYEAEGRLARFRNFTDASKAQEPVEATEENVGKSNVSTAYIDRQVSHA